MSYEEIGEILGISTSRVQQIGNQTLAKLRKRLANREVCAEDLTSPLPAAKRSRFPNSLTSRINPSPAYPDARHQAWF